MENQGARTTPRSRHHSSSRTTAGGGSIGGGGGREDCWSEGATETLIEAWGDRYVELNRGNLRQKDWKEVADFVNSRQNGVKPRRTDIQCKNRVDTLKKKYKLEKSKPVPSKWPFYSRLDFLVGATATATPPANKKVTATPPPPQRKSPAVTFTVNPYKEKLNNNYNPNAAVYSGGSSSKSRLNSAGSTESSRGGGLDERDEEEEEVDVLDGRVRKHRMGSMDSSDEAACRELARAVLKFGEIYERIESSKQHQMMELEKQRMEFTKDLEFKRMHMFMEAQIELEKMKRPKFASSSGKKL